MVWCLVEKALSLASRLIQGIEIVPGERARTWRMRKRGRDRGASKQKARTAQKNEAHARIRQHSMGESVETHGLTTRDKVPPPAVPR